jgi:hypothetical protein
MWDEGGEWVDIERQGLVVNFIVVGRGFLGPLSALLGPLDAAAAAAASTLVGSAWIEAGTDAMVSADTLAQTCSYVDLFCCQRLIAKEFVCAMREIIEVDQIPL